MQEFLVQHIFSDSEIQEEIVKPKNKLKDNLITKHINISNPLSRMFLFNLSQKFNIIDLLGRKKEIIKRIIDSIVPTVL